MIKKWQLRTFSLLLSMISVSFPVAAETSERKIPGIATMAAGGLISIVGFVYYLGPPAGGNPCSEETKRSGESEDECWDRVDDDRKEARKIGQVVLPVGLATLGVGYWLLQSDTNEVAFRIDPRLNNIDLAWRVRF